MNLSLFLLAASEALRVSTLWQALPLSGFSFVRRIKVKFYLTLSLRWIRDSFPFPCLRGIFLFEEGLCFSPKILNSVRGWGWKKDCSYYTERFFFPLSIPKTGDKIQRFSLKKQAPTLSRARTRLHQSGDYEQQREAYTNSHTHLHTNSVLASPHQNFAAHLLYY